MENYVDESVYECGLCDEIEEGKFFNIIVFVFIVINVNLWINWWVIGIS